MNMNDLFFILIFNIFLLYTFAQVYECPNYDLINSQQRNQNKKPKQNNPLQCNQILIHPKKVINRYKKGLQDYVQPKPFGSICLKCSICRVVAKEMDKIFCEISDANRKTKQTEVMTMIEDDIKLLCSTGFEKYDLRKFKQTHEITDEFADSTHVRSRMDGQWTEKLREMCTTYFNHMDTQNVLNDYLKEKPDLSNYLCRSTGIFRDCISLTFENSEQNDATCGQI